MTIKPMTQAELDNRPDILPFDKELIERVVDELGGDLCDGKPDTPIRQGIRGYLVAELDENEINDQLRYEIELEAASFVEGWNAAMAAHLVPDGFMCGGCGAMVAGETLPEDWKTRKRRGGHIFLCPKCLNPPEGGT